jgi:hypothetical protein
MRLKELERSLLNVNNECDSGVKFFPLNNKEFSRFRSGIGFVYNILLREDGGLLMIFFQD